MRITDLALKAIKPPATGQKFYADDTTPNFGVRISQGGTMTFVLIHGERANRRKIAIGRYPTISLSQARTEARRLAAELTLGKRHSASVTYESVKKKFLAECEANNRERTHTEYTRQLKHFPLSGMIDEVRKQDVLKKLDRIKAPSERAHALAVLKIMFSWALRHDFIDRNPCDGLRRSLAHNGMARERVLDHKELKAVLLAAGVTEYPFGPIVQLLALTGQRRGEIAALKWEWINQKDKTFTLPSHVTKNGRPHTFPYGDMTQDILDRLPEPGEYLFPATRSHVRGRPTTVFNSWSKSKSLLKADIPHWTLHDLRRTFSSTLAALGTPIHVTEKLLNHASGTISGVAAVYNRHSYFEEMKQAVTTYENHLAKLLKS